MHDHETYLLLAAKRLSEPLSHEEEADLEAHLAACPSCRTIAAGMRRDDVRLHAAFQPVPVAPRVRDRVLAEAAGRRTLNIRTTLLLAAALALGLIGAPLIAGRPGDSPAASLPSPIAALASATPSVPSATVAATASASPTVQPSASAPSPAPVPTGTGPFVAGNYTYASRRDSVAARLENGAPSGEWWRETTVSGKKVQFGGPITCFVIDGKVAWLAGSATTATDGRTGLAIFFELRDGGSDGTDDAAIGYLTNPGQTLTTMQTWCETKYTPDGPFPLTSGNVVVEPNG